MILTTFPTCITNDWAFYFARRWTGDTTTIEWVANGSNERSSFDVSNETFGGVYVYYYFELNVSFVIDIDGRVDCLGGRKLIKEGGAG